MAKAKIFYDHLVAREEIIAVLDKHKLAVEEREELVALIDEHLHHHVLDTILTHLPRAKHKEFLEKFHKNPADEGLLVYLRESVEVDIEAEIASRAKKVKSELLSEISRARKK